LHNRFKNVKEWDKLFKENRLISCGDTSKCRRQFEGERLIQGGLMPGLAERELQGKVLHLAVE